MRNFFLFGLNLVILGTVILSHIPIGLTAFTDVEMGRVAYMTSFESTDRNAVEMDSIPMTISVPYFILPIPEKKLNLGNPLPLTVTITNNTAKFISVEDKDLTPELVAPNGQALQLQRTRDPNLDTTNFCRLVKPKTAFLFSPAALAWKNNKLQLYGNARLGYGWYFDDIKPGLYRLRFAYYSPGGNVSCYDLETQKLSRVEGLETRSGATIFVPIHIVQPVSIDSNTVEVDGVRFEIVTPKRMLSIPENKPDATTPIKIGLRITNKTATPLRFHESYKALEILGQDGKKLPGKGRDGSRNYRTAYNCPLVRPGESVIFSLDVNLYWQNNLLQFVTSDGFGGFRYFNDLKPGKYRIRLGYYPSVSRGSCNLEVQNSTLLEDMWEGLGATPFVEIHLVQP